MHAKGARASSPAIAPKGWHSRGYLPHLDAPDLVQAVTFRLADALPGAIAERIRQQAKDDATLRRRLVAGQLDAGHGSCRLRGGEAASLVEEALLHDDGGRYRLLAWVIMPNHVHVIVELAGTPLARIVGAWKSVTARRLGGGRVWQPDYFDRYVRDDRHLVAARRYVEENPVKAGLGRVARALGLRQRQIARALAGGGARAP